MIVLLCIVVDSDRRKIKGTMGTVLQHNQTLQRLVDDSPAFLSPALLLVNVPRAPLLHWNNGGDVSRATHT